MYKLATTISEISDYIGNADLLALDIETSPKPEFRNDPKAALDSHKATITGISLSGSEGSGIYLPFRHEIGVNADFNVVWTWIKNRECL